jgi:hypothetical protein
LARAETTEFGEAAAIHCEAWRRIFSPRPAIAFGEGGFIVGNQAFNPQHWVQQTRNNPQHLGRKGPDFKFKI